MTKSINHITLDEKSFEKIFKEYFISLCAFAIKYIHDTDEAKDIVHQVYMNLWEKRNEIKMSGSIRSYLYTSVHNRCLNYIRDHKKFIYDDYPDSKENLNPFIENSDYLEVEELRSHIYKALYELPEGCRKIFTLSRYDGKKYKEIAQELGISIKTVETQMSKALKHMKSKLIKYITYISLLIGLLINFIK